MASIIGCVWEAGDVKYVRIEYLKGVNGHTIYRGTISHGCNDTFTINLVLQGEAAIDDLCKVLASNWLGHGVQANQNLSHGPPVQESDHNSNCLTQAGSTIRI